METRSIKELLQVILDNFDVFKKKSCSGMCTLIYYLFYNDILNKEEHILVRKYMRENKPKKTYNDVFWFEPKKQEPRKQWLINEIKKHELWKKDIK